MKRFWVQATVEPTAGGHAVLLDGRAVRTPKRALLLLPNRALAAAIAAEWNAVDGEMTPGNLPLTGLANAAIDIVAPDVSAFAQSLARYAENDLTCYRADGPDLLVSRQAAAWEPPLKAVEARHGLLFRRTTGIVHVPQPANTLGGVAAILHALSPWVLAPLQPIVTLTGSAVLGLALVDGLASAEAVFAAGEVDGDFQAEMWGEDALAQAARAARQQEFGAAVVFLNGARASE